MNNLNQRSTSVNTTVQGAFLRHLTDTYPQSKVNWALNGSYSVHKRTSEPIWRVLRGIAAEMRYWASELRCWASYNRWLSDALAD